MIEIKPTGIREVIEIFPKLFSDDRGMFFESYNTTKYKALGLPEFFAQDNISVSKKNVLRGLHYQNPKTQGKLVQVISGEIFDVAVDLRQSSATFKRWVGRKLNNIQRNQLWVPPCFAHGFLVLSDEAVVLYKATDYYSPENDHTILWNDPTIGVDWPVSSVENIIVSDKDNLGLLLSDSQLFD